MRSFIQLRLSAKYFFMSKNNQLIIDLGDVKLTAKQLKSLHDTIHKAVFKKIKEAKVKAKKHSLKEGAPVTAAINDKGHTATLQVDFNTVDPGLSELTATHNAESKTIHESDTISFDNVKMNDTIVIKGSSAGSKTVTISGVKATPIQMNFAEGQHVNGIFLILE
jgi:hypothetical protein